MIEEGSLPAIQDWLIKKLEPISDAEPSVLATYIIALLNKEDKTLDEIRNTCTDQLTDFLKSDTLPFVDSLFQVIKQEDGKILFDSGAGRISKAESFQDSDSDSDRDYRRRDKRRSEESSRSPPRRRGRDDRNYSSSRSSSNSRRSPDRKRSRQHKKPCRDYEEKGFCYRGENCPYDHGDDRIVVNSQDSNRDYNEYVVPFPTSSIPVATFTNTGPMMPPMGMMGIPMNMGVPMMPPMQTIAPIFNPNSSDNDTIVQVGGKGMYNKRERPERPDRSERHERTDRGDRGDRGERGERNERGDRGERKNKFGSVNNTIVISNIPDSVNGIDSLNSYFKTFGNIINIQVKFGQQKALVQFAKREDATKALQSTLTSPFDHPNIKISWAKKFDRQDNDNNNNNNTPTPPPVTPKPDPSTYVAPIATKTTSTSHKAIFNVNASSTTPAIISDKKEEAKKQVKERSSKTIEESKQSLEQAKKLLLTLDTAKIDPQEKAALMKKIADLTESIHTSIAKESTVLEKVKESENIKKIVKKPKLVPNTVTVQDKQRLEKERLDKELEAITTSPPTTATATPSDTSASSDSTTTTTSATTTTAANTSNIERLQQKYATLKKMAASLGYTEPSGAISGAPMGRGRGRGRGGMATAPPRKSMTLDNRTSTLKLDKLPENLRSKDAIQNHFKNFEIKSIELGDSGDTALVQFANRKAAELAVVKAKVYENANLSMQWHTVKPSNNANFEDAQEKVQVYQPRTEEEEEEEEEDDDSDSWKRKR